MSKRKILYLITKGNWGGAQRYVYDLATSLPQDKFSITVAVGQTGQLIEKLNKKGINTVNTSYLQRDIGLFRELKAFFNTYRLIKKEKPDIIHLNSSKAGGLGAVAAKITGIPKIIFTIHGLPGQEPRPKWQKFLINIFTWLTIVFCHKIITVSAKEARILKSWPLIKNKIFIITNGLPEINFKTKEIARELLLKKINLNKIDNNHLWLGTIAELHPNKDLSTIIKAVALVIDKNPHTILVIIGSGQEKNKLQKLIKQLAKQQNIFLLGSIPEAGSYLKALDIFLLSSVKEGLPYVILEAGQAELATIATTVGGIPEIITDKNNGLLFKPKDINQAVFLITELLAKPNLRQKLGQELKKTITTDFTLKKMVDQTLELY
ncbi:MAG: glycosyltransferase family 4 protein [Patescibacteria group bacterium]